MDDSKRKRLQSISLWIIITAILVNQCYQIYLIHQKDYRLHQCIHQLYERQIDVDEAQLLFHQRIVESLEKYSEHSGK